ncbi:NUDIX hydrolase [Parendozoicomonas haliclonae]|uniref:NrtR DNA-binding winged helix domain-containing protein n=1 Tax=Parendozoicomonas haliclonae TaxID=1960125 RepID=A0A1X7AIJ7_9GAMM|nr:NUDIX hydrolase [Parendozoicomonas haliclonae]SMA43789.1 hypothetical protein EHSB41UT_01665 [Parendozoicomonas haliclonae]
MSQSSAHNPATEPLPLSMALISVDCVVLRLHQGQLQVLTAPAGHPNARHPFALPAGRIEISQDHNLEQAARRHIGYLTQTVPSWLEQVETIGNDSRDSRGWSLTVVYFALMRDEPEADTPDARWHDITPGGELPALAYDHQILLKAAIERLCNKIQYTTLPLYLLPESFALADIRDVFQSLLGKAPPMRSLRNRFNEETVLEGTGEKRYGSNRPATLYRMKSEAVGKRMFSRLYESTR